MKKRVLSGAVSLALTAISAVSPLANAINEPYAGHLTDNIKSDYIKVEDKDWLINLCGRCDDIYMKLSDKHSASFYIVAKFHDGVRFTVSKEADITLLETLIKDVDDNLVFQYSKSASSDIYGCSILKNEQTEYYEIDMKTVKAVYQAIKEYLISFEYSFDIYVSRTAGITYLTGYHDNSSEKILNEYLEKNNINAKLMHSSDPELDLPVEEYRGVSLFIVSDEEITAMEHYELAKNIAEETGLMPSGGRNTAIDRLLHAEIIDFVNSVAGDANCDNNMSMSDAVLIMQSLANPSKYSITAQGQYNADTDDDGITNLDALSIQKKLLKLE